MKIKLYNFLFNQTLICAILLFQLIKKKLEIESYLNKFVTLLFGNSKFMWISLWLIHIR